MISSLSLKETPDITKKDADYTRFSYENSSPLNSNPKRMNYIGIPNSSIMNDSRRVISLPKTKMTRRGQLYLYTNGKDEKEQPRGGQEPSKLKPYSKKWIEDITLDLGIETAQLLDNYVKPKMSDGIGKSDEAKRNMSRKLGKLTDHFVNDLKSRSTGRDRCMSRSSYLEFLPNDYDVKSQLAETLRTVAMRDNRQDIKDGNRENVNKNINEQTSVPTNQHSRVSFGNNHDVDYVDCCISSDEEEKIFFNSSESTKPNSRLSNQPVLSAKSLINRLSCKIKDDQSIEDSTTVNNWSDSSKFSIKYKAHFKLDETEIETTSNNISANTTKAKRHEPSTNLKPHFNDNQEIGNYEARISSIDSKRILTRRVESQQSARVRQNSLRAEFETPAAATTLYPAEANVVYMDELRMLSNANSQQSHDHHDNVVVMPTLDHADHYNPLSSLAVAKLSPRAPPPPQAQQQHQKPRAFSPPPTTSTKKPSELTITNRVGLNLHDSLTFLRDDQDGDSSSITISVRRVNNEKTGGQKIERRFFDRRCLRIKKMSMSAKPTITQQQHQANVVNIDSMRRVFSSVERRRSSRPNLDEPVVAVISSPSNRKDTKRPSFLLLPSTSTIKPPGSANQAIRDAPSTSGVAQSRVKSAPSRHLKISPTTTSDLHEPFMGEIPKKSSTSLDHYPHEKQLEGEQTNPDAAADTILDMIEDDRKLHSSLNDFSDDEMISFERRTKQNQDQDENDDDNDEVFNENQENDKQIISSQSESVKDNAHIDVDDRIKSNQELVLLKSHDDRVDSRQTKPILVETTCEAQFLDSSLIIEEQNCLVSRESEIQNDDKQTEQKTNENRAEESNKLNVDKVDLFESKSSSKRNSLSPADDNNNRIDSANSSSNLNKTPHHDSPIFIMSHELIDEEDHHPMNDEHLTKINEIIMGTDLHENENVKPKENDDSNQSSFLSRKSFDLLNDDEFAATSNEMNQEKAFSNDISTVPTLVFNETRSQALNVPVVDDREENENQEDINSAEILENVKHSHENNSRSFVNSKSPERNEEQIVGVDTNVMTAQAEPSLDSESKFDKKFDEASKVTLKMTVDEKPKIKEQEKELELTQSQADTQNNKNDIVAIEEHSGNNNKLASKPKRVEFANEVKEKLIEEADSVSLKNGYQQQVEELEKIESPSAFSEILERKSDLLEEAHQNIPDEESGNQDEEKEKAHEDHVHLEEVKHHRPLTSKSSSMSRTSQTSILAETVAPSGNKRIVLKKDNVKTKSPLKPKTSARQSDAKAIQSNLSKSIKNLPTKEITKSNVSLDEKSEISNASVAVSDEESDRINILLGIKKDKSYAHTIMPPVIATKETAAKYPHLKIPWNYQEAVVNQQAYHSKFDLPDSLCPELRRIDPRNVSIEELAYERRVLEERIQELRKSKLETDTNAENKKSGKSSKKSSGKKGSKKLADQQRRLKDIQSKERVIFEERLRLHDETVRNHIEREKMRKMMSDKINEKQNEIEELENQMETSTHEYERQRKFLEEQLKYLEGTEDEIREAMVRARVEFRDQLVQNQARTRTELKQMQEERREEKLFEFDVKRKELAWLLEIHVEEEEISRVRAQLADLELTRERWLRDHENRMIDEEQELDEREEDEEARLNQTEQEEEEAALGDLHRQQFQIMQERKTLIETYEDLKMKIQERIKNIKEEKKFIESEKKSFEEGMQMNVEKQREKLEEIINSEYDAREQIKSELDAYRYKLMSQRERNLEMKCDMTFLEHCHAINKPYVFSYGIHWPYKLLTGAENDQKKPKRSP